jgi:tRNA-specific 2-thiouridylase
VKVLVAMSGGVDSSVAAARCLAAGHETVGVTMKLWGGPSDTGCCSVADVDDARRVADRLDIDHHVFNFGDDFEAKVIDPYVDDHVAGRTPNPCIECNRHLKFDRLFARAADLGFETVATGHHARVVERGDGRWALARGADAVKDQSYVLSMLDQATLARTLFPVGDLTKEAVRDEARRMGLRTADKPDSQDVCFITSTQGRSGFLAERIDPTPADVVDPSGAVKGRVDAVELVTIGQRRGLGLAGGTPPRFVTEVRPASSTSSAQVTIGRREDLLTDRTGLGPPTWVDGPVSGAVLGQTSAHGTPGGAQLTDGEIRWDEPRSRVALGQTVAFYDVTDPDVVLGSSIAV